MSRKSKSVPVDIKLALVTTGGTIAGLKTDKSHYQSAALNGQALADQLGLNVNVGDTPIEWSVYSPYAIGSQNLTWTEMFTLRELLIQLNADPSIHGILVTHGTDTMEDMLFFLSISLPALLKPIVFTGSMLTSDSPDSDAQSNVADSVRLLASSAKSYRPSLDSTNPIPSKRLAASPPLFGLVMNGKFTSASLVHKVNTSGVDAFDLPVSKPTELVILHAIEGRAFDSEPFRSTFVLPDWSAEQFIQALESVLIEVAYCTPHLRTGSLKSRMASGDGSLAHATNTHSKRTLVVAAPGNGNIPSRFIPELEELMSQGVRVVRASRITQSALGQGGELTGLEAWSHSGAMKSTSMSSISMGFSGYHEAQGLSLNQVIVMETCRMLK